MCSGGQLHFVPRYMCTVEFLAPLGLLIITLFLPIIYTFCTVNSIAYLLYSNTHSYRSLVFIFHFLVVCRFSSLATSSLPPSPAFTCSVCQMFSYSSSSFSDNGTCNKCSLFVDLEARLSELEAQLCIIENHPKASQTPLASAEPPGVASSISRPLSPSRTRAAGTPEWLGACQEKES